MITSAWSGAVGVDGDGSAAWVVEGTTCRGTLVSVGGERRYPGLRASPPCRPRHHWRADLRDSPSRTDRSTATSPFQRGKMCDWNAWIFLQVVVNANC